MKRSAAAFVVLVLLGAFVAVSLAGGAASSTDCTKAEKSKRAAAAAAYAKAMPKKRATYNKTHKSQAARTAFAKRQAQTLARLRSAAKCSVPVATPAPTTTAPVVPQHSVEFSPEMSAADQDLIRSDVEFALQDEAALLGPPITKVAAFASADPKWLAEHQCRAQGYNDSGCFDSLAKRYAAGGSAAQGGPGVIALNWGASTWKNAPAWLFQKTIAHELFHTFQYQLDKLLNNGQTPSSQVRPSGPVWLDEGAAEVIGYRVASDRGLQSYSSELVNQKNRAKQVGVALDQLQTLDQTQPIPTAYSLFLVAVDHLVEITPSHLGALTTYYNALGAGKAWPDAFVTAFGMTVDAYYANFAAYRSSF